MIKYNKTVAMTAAFVTVLAYTYGSSLYFDKNIGEYSYDKSEFESIIYQDDCTTAPAYWFPHEQTPPPKEGVDSPFGDADSTKTCDFHMWSWQKFLYLTQTPEGGNGKARFENLIHVDNHLEPLMENIEGTNLILNDTTQAGFTAGTLYDKKNNPIYYSIYVNSTMFDFSQDALNTFSKTGINNLEKMGYDSLNYPVGSLEIKASWMLTSDMSNSELADYYVTQAHMGSSDGEIMDVALIGIHIVGVVENHPEFIWATFEHTNLAPDYDWNSRDGIAQVLSSEDMTFYSANQTAEQCRMNSITAKQSTFKSIYRVYALGMAQGMDSLPSLADKENNKNIEDLNKSVHNSLAVEVGPWKNYFYAGSVWIDPTVSELEPDDKGMGELTNDNLTGSRACANITMETYEQPDANTSQFSGSKNCFSCHTTYDDDNRVGYNLALSHLFTNALARKLNPLENYDNN